MTDLELLDLARHDLDRVLGRVSDDQWDAPTPCEGWTVADVIKHLVGGSQMAAILARGGTREEAVDVLGSARVGDDPLATFSSAANAQAAALAEGDPARIVPHPAMDMPAGMLAQFRVGDFAVHAWDIAQAIGYDLQIHPEVVRSIHDRLAAMAPMLAASGQFGSGPSDSLPDDASLQDRMLDLTGRRPA